MSYFTVDILTPSKIVGRNLPATTLYIPTCRGEIQVLPEHTHLMTKLETGILTLQQDGQALHFLVSSGVCKIIGNKVQILTKISEKASDVDAVKAKESLTALQGKAHSSGSMTDEEIQEFQEKIKLAETRIKLAAQAGGHH